MSSSLLSPITLPPSLITLPPSQITLPPSQMTPPSQTPPSQTPPSQTPPSQTQFAVAPGAPTKKINHFTVSEQSGRRILF